MTLLLNTKNTSKYIPYSKYSFWTPTTPKGVHVRLPITISEL